MKHGYSEYLKLLDNFTNEEKINKINIMINKTQADICIIILGNTRDNRYDGIKQLKQIKNSISL